MRLLSNLIKVGSLMPLLLMAPVIAHEVKTSPQKDVAATFHLEPSHQPKAGKPAKVWFALTRKGGQVIPYAQCDCQLAVYPISGKKGNALPLMKPQLSAIDIERYKGIPSAVITFPKAG